MPNKIVCAKERERRTALEGTALRTNKSKLKNPPAWCGGPFHRD